MGIISPVATDTNGNAKTVDSMQSLDKDAFLQLLITKLTHQDPLKPMEDEAFVAELAQFSSLEQMQNMNKNLERALEWDLMQIQTINNTMATSLIGKEVSASYQGIYLDEINQPAITFTSDEYISEAKVTITDADGNVVRTLGAANLGPGIQTLYWDGRDQQGNRVDEGYYTIAIAATDAAGDSVTTSTLLKGPVTGVSYREGSAFLQVNGVEIPLADIRNISQYTENDSSDSEGENN